LADGDALLRQGQGRIRGLFFIGGIDAYEAIAGADGSLAYANLSRIGVENFRSG